MHPALPDLQHALNTTPTGVSWIFTMYLLSASVATPIAGRLGDMFGKERVLIVVLFALAVGTVISALSTSIGPMIAGRGLQGIGGAVFPLGIGIVRDEFPRERVATGIALISATFAVGGGIGIMLAGPIVENLNYHYLFWIPLVPVVFALIATWLWVPESPVRSPGRVNWQGALLLSGWLVCLLLGLSEAPTWHWLSARVLGPVRARARAAARVGARGVALERAARRHGDDARARRLDRQPRHGADRLRHVQRVRAHPRVRRVARRRPATASGRASRRPDSSCCRRPSRC